MSAEYFFGIVPFVAIGKVLKINNAVFWLLYQAVPLNELCSRTLKFSPILPKLLSFVQAEKRNQDNAHFTTGYCCKIGTPG